MSSDDSDRLEDLFAAALERPAAEREAFVASACAGQPALLARVRSLLAAHDKADGFLEKQSAKALTEALRALRPAGTLPDLVGATLGPYRITGRLGEGGVGIVYLAEQSAPLRREVALKVLKPGMDSGEVLARFEAERQALALMDHPNIARVFDAGCTPDGHPYFVMERVHGVPITRHCDDKRLTPEARLALFREVCAAVQHAHHKGVIHRDLKPSNILVAEDGRPRIIDFGIAKAISSRLGDATLSTAVSHVLGTPAYMSPEQAESPASVDTRGDVFSLGVLLHELLTGRPPVDTNSLLQAGIDAMRRRLRETEAARPSTLLRTLDKVALAEAAARRQTDPATLVRAVSGELDWIVLRCLERDRDRRYASPHELSEDLRRHLQHEPVLAAPPGIGYALRKLARRHRAATAAALAIAASLALGAGVSTWQAVRATRAERLAEQRRSDEAAARAAAETAERQARDEAAISAAVVKFLRQDVLEQAAPDTQPERDLPLRKALDNASKAVGTAFPDQPLVEAAIRDTIGITYGSLGSYAAARDHYRRAWELRRVHLGPDNVSTLATANNLIAQLGNLEAYDEAEKLSTEALALSTKAHGRDSLGSIELLANMGSNRLQQGRVADSEPVLAEALSLARKALGNDHRATQSIMSNLSGAYIQLERFAEAAALLEELIAVRSRLLGPDHPRTLNAMQNRSGLLARLGRGEECLAICRAVYAGRSRVQGPEHPQTLIALKNVGDACEVLGLLDEAETHYAAALEAQTRLLGPEHRRVTDLREALEGVRRRKAGK